MDDYISRQAAIDALDKRFDSIPMEQTTEILQLRKDLRDLPSAQPEPCEDAVPRASVEYICRKNTVSTNPYEHEHHEKFIKFMDDPEIADFGRWQHSNGFNTALVAVKCDLDKVPSVTPKQRTGKWIRPAGVSDCSYQFQCSECGKIAYQVTGNCGRKYKDRTAAACSYKWCPNCGAKMDEVT